MRKPNRALRVIGAVAMIVGLLAAMVAPVMAQGFEPGPGEDHNPVAPDSRHLESAIYFPWVANDDATLGLGPADTMISIQNLEDRDAEITISVGGTGGLTTYLSRYASKTFTAEELGISSGSGAPVRVTALNSQHGFPARGYQGSEQLFPIYWDDLDNTPWGCFVVRPEQANLLPPRPGYAPPGYQERINELPLEVPRSFIATVDIPYHEWTRWILNPDTLVWEPRPDSAGPFPAGSFVHLDEQYTVIEDEDDDDQDAGGNTYDLDVWFQIQSIWETINGGDDGEINPFGGLGIGGNCNAWVDGGVVHSPVAIGGVAKMAVDGENLPMTSAADAAVSGYNAINGWEVFRFDEWYLPIVQTNCGPGGCWDSTIRVAALGGSLNSVTVRFFPADDGSGSLQTGFQLQRKINGGTTWNIDLSDYVPQGWVGSAHVYTDGAVYAMVDRFKVGYNMWITNTGSSADYENVAQINLNTNTNLETGRYVLFAPHVLVDYFGWNTGINVANLANEHNNINIQYFNLFGNATQGATQRLAPHGMTYFYDPSMGPQNENQQDVETDTTGDIVGSALIWSDYPVAAVVDATKYPESDPSGRTDLYQATSYSATQNIYTWQAVPFVSKGNPIDGTGATSGVNIMNPNPGAATANVYFVNENGFQADNFGISSVTIPGYANGFIYTLWQENLPNGFFGAAQVISNIPVAAVSANVDYTVTGDGSAIFNAFNPCGFYRTAQGDTAAAYEIGRLMPDCSFGDALDVTGGSVTKTFLGPNDEPVPGVIFSIVNQNPDFPYTQTGETGPDGSTTFHNVPVGDYNLNVVSVPDDYVMPENPADTFTLNEGEDVSLVNRLETEGFEFTKYVYLADSDDVGLQNVNIRIWPRVGETLESVPVVPDVDDLSAFGWTDVDGEFTASLTVGEYVLCMFFPQGLSQYVDPVSGGIVTINVDGTWEIDGNQVICEIIEVVTEEDENFLVNEVIGGDDDVLGQIDITTIVPEEDRNFGQFTVCLHDAESDAELVCQIMAADEHEELTEGFYFANIPTGTYYLVATQGPLVSTSDDFEYSIVLDARDGFVDDILNPDLTDDSGGGAIRAGGEWDVVIGDANTATFIDAQPGPGQTP